MTTSPSGGLQVSSDIADALPCTAADCVAAEANTWVRGYPSVLYGIDQCNAATSPPDDPDLVLPMQVQALPDGLIGTTVYDVRSTDITYNVAYDLWLNASDTISPCRVEGTLEVMVWTDYDTEALLPDSMKVGRATIPFAVDGRSDDGRDAWSVYVSNVFEAGRTVPWGGTIWYVIDPEHRMTQGSVAVDLATALKSTAALLESVYGWRDVETSYWLDTIAFGVEFGPSSAELYSGGPTPFAFDLRRYCLTLNSSPAGAGC